MFEIPARVTDEPRWLMIGTIDGKHWSAVITRREENVRLISVRRSRDEEVTVYESEDIDRKFDAGEKIADQLDLSKARRIGSANTSRK